MQRSLGGLSSLPQASPYLSQRRGGEGWELGQEHEAFLVLLIRVTRGQGTRATFEAARLFCLFHCNVLNLNSRCLTRPEGGMGLVRFRQMDGLWVEK